LKGTENKRNFHSKFYALYFNVFNKVTMTNITWCTQNTNTMHWQQHSYLAVTSWTSRSNNQLSHSWWNISNKSVLLWVDKMV